MAFFTRVSSKAGQRGKGNLAAPAGTYLPSYIGVKISYLITNLQST